MKLIKEEVMMNSNKKTIDEVERHHHNTHFLYIERNKTNTLTSLSFISHGHQ